MGISKNRRIAINSGVLYLRVILTLFLTLFATRFILIGLGEGNFGLYNLIAGVVGLFSFISGTMSATTQRFISYEFGASHDIQQVSMVFNTSFKLHCIIAFIVVSIVIISGIVLIDNVLSIPFTNIQLAKIVLLCVAIGLIGTILSVPFEATLMAHENILFFAIIQFIGVILRFGIAFVLIFLNSNQLLVYAILMAAIPFILLFSQATYCITKYPETRINRNYMKLRGNRHLKKMSSFASYALFGSIGWTIRTQGFSIILNIFWGVLINAANGIANQVSAALLTFSNSLTTSIRPQLIQAAGENNSKRMIQLTIAACRYPFIIISIIGVPLFITMPFILEIWLKEVPSYSILFCRVLIVDVLLNQSTLGLALIMDAKGEIKTLHIIVGISLIITTLIVFFIAKYTNSVENVYGFMIINDIVIVVIRILIVKYYLSKWDLKFDYKNFLFNILLKPFIATASIMILGVIVWNLHIPSLTWFIVVATGFLLTYSTIVWNLMLNNHEKQLILSLKNKFIKC